MKIKPGWLVLGMAGALTLGWLSLGLQAPEAAPAQARAVANLPALAARTAPAPAPAQTFTLSLSVPEPVLVGGRAERPTVTRRYVLTLTPEQRAALRAGGSLAPLRVDLDRIYREVEARTPQDLRFVQEGDRWVGRAQTGWKVDRAATEAALRRAVGAGAGGSALNVALQAPERSVRWGQAQGLTHLAGGESSFAGSPAFRVQNIRVGASRVHGTWVAAGRSFSFNRAVGRIRAANGFVPGYVITGGTLSKEDGGGICQVSTTVFRAAYAAGLPITERHAHSYQVAYYGDPGMDAAVYAPSKDLRWRNDTGGPLLVQASWDVKAERLRVDLFGRSDGRQVKVAAPKISGSRLAPDPTFVADPALAAGETRRLDMPAPGARVAVVRQVRLKGGVVREDVTRSSYRPWGGVFVVAPGDQRLR
ncbi:VanW family protein [Deinococcus gobiensis]|uniref:VanW family protein n=1 Tax=Deinococcus gobiensis TaxID=502394 RepID=UPI00030B3E25|nr:VanW family protein [Deinococcus gobiensis]